MSPRISARFAWAMCGLTLVMIACTLALVALNRYDVREVPYFLVAEATAALAVGALSVASLVVRYRRSRGQERQQIKWVAYAAVFLVVFEGLWVAVAVAILRYRLYDVDVVINRTLVYGSLTVSLALVYFGSIVVLQALFHVLTGQESQLAMVASTLAIAALFNPLRRRIQQFVDRRFYRGRYDAAKTLETFSARLRDETGLGTLSEDLVGVVRQTLQPAHVSLWLWPAPKSGEPGERRRARLGSAQPARRNPVRFRHKVSPVHKSGLRLIYNRARIETSEDSLT
jgi:hypothetical protein